MPELPEVETVRRGLSSRIVDERVSEVEVTGARTIRRQPLEEFVSLLKGRRFQEPTRRGKFLLLPLDDGLVLVVHLRMSGQLVYVSDRKIPLAKHTHARIGLSSGAELRFVDPRTFGELFVTDDLDETGLPNELRGLGADPLLEPLDAKALSALLARRKGALKAVLLDQRRICGIGNIYADEICFAARLRPTRPAQSLRRGECQRLASAIEKVLDDAVAHRGSSLGDGQYVDLEGSPGSYQAHHAVYGKADKPCPRCATPIVRVKIAGRSAHYCPHCQH